MFFRFSFNGYSVKFSPFEEGRIAVATAQNFGIIGNGRQYVLQVSGYAPHYRTAMHDISDRVSLLVPDRSHLDSRPSPSRPVCEQITPNGLREVAVFDTTDGLYDCAWSEDNENILVSASGDGSIKVWDLHAPPTANPLRSFEEHSREVHNGGAHSSYTGTSLPRYLHTC